MKEQGSDRQGCEGEGVEVEVVGEAYGRGK